MVAAYKGICIIMHHKHNRNLRPWEQVLDSEPGGGGRSSFASTADRTFQMASRTGNYDDTDDDNSFRSSSMSTFGPRNDWEHASWVENYQKKSLLRKVFDKSTWTQNETLKVLQDKIVLGANLWALVITIPLTVAFVAIPKGNLY